MQLLLISKGRYKGGKYLAHVPVKDLFENIIWKGYRPEEHPVIFVPFAEEEKNWDASAEQAGKFFKENGFPFVSMHSSDYKESTSPNRGILCIGEGNVFRLSQTLNEKRLFDSVKKLAETERCIAVGAGCTMLNKTIILTCDTPASKTLYLSGLGVNEHPAIPNFTLGGLTHTGAPIEESAQEYFKETMNDVLGLPESCYMLKLPSYIYVGGGEGEAAWWFNDEKKIAKWPVGEGKWSAMTL